MGLLWMETEAHLPLSVCSLLAVRIATSQQETALLQDESCRPSASRGPTDRPRGLLLLALPFGFSVPYGLGLIIIVRVIILAAIGIFILGIVIRILSGGIIFT